MAAFAITRMDVAVPRCLEQMSLTPKHNSNDYFTCAEAGKRLERAVAGLVVELLSLSFVSPIL
jgi:hypothetical protein